MLSELWTFIKIVFRGLHKMDVSDYQSYAYWNNGPCQTSKTPRNKGSLIAWKPRSGVYCYDDDDNNDGDEEDVTNRKAHRSTKRPDEGA